MIILSCLFLTMSFQFQSDSYEARLDAIQTELNQINANFEYFLPVPTYSWRAGYTPDSPGPRGRGAFPGGRRRGGGRGSPRPGHPY
jgi:hypothetical protein